MPRSHLLLRSLTFQIFVWGLLLCAGAAALAAWQYRALVGELEQESAQLHKLASQRAGQHDAHLTALSAIVVATEAHERSLFLEVAQTITNFYPRIDEIQLVPLRQMGGVVGTRALSPDLEDIIRSAANASEGKIALLSVADHPDHYLMIKRSPNTADARYGLMLAIDAGGLLGQAGRYWSRQNVGLGLFLPDGQPVFRLHRLPSVPQYSRALGSVSQPLVLKTGINIDLADLLPPWRLALILLSISMVYFALLAVWRERARVLVAQEQARLSAIESRLAHASRVNALGEMASGLTHELTQPLTAILAQTQAGLRMMGKGDNALLGTVLKDTVTQAQRASAILARFRNWARPQRASSEVFDLRGALNNVQALLTPQAASSEVALEFNVPPQAVLVNADPVEMEQVVFNLVRNAIEALDGHHGEGRVVVDLTEQASGVVLEVMDNGPGVSNALRPHLFTPFATEREGGMGLGLALSQRLVERAGGDIAWVDTRSGTTFRVSLPRAIRAAGAGQ